MKKIALSLFALSALFMSSHAFSCELREIDYNGQCYSGYENYYAN
jgi:hypothetical protein